MSDKPRMKVSDALAVLKAMTERQRHDLARRNRLREWSVDMPSDASWATLQKIRNAVEREQNTTAQ